MSGEVLERDEVGFGVNVDQLISDIRADQTRQIGFGRNYSVAYKKPEMKDAQQEPYCDALERVEIF